MENSPRKCLVTGATGVVGVPLVRELVGRGHKVKILARGEVSPGDFLNKAEIVRGDLADEKALKIAAEDVNWIFHLAAKLHVNSPDGNLRSEYEKTNVAGTAALLELARQNNAQKFVFFSTINVYGASENKTIFDEASRLNPQGFYAETKAAAEESVLQATNENGEKIGVVLRLAAVYGSRMKGNYLRLLRAIRRRRFFFIGDGANRRTLVHQQDAARAAILAAEMGQTSGQIYNVTDGEVYTLREIVGAMSEALSTKTPKLRLPLAPIRLGVGAAEKVVRLIGIKNMPLNRDLLEKFLEDTAVSGEKIRQELGFRPQFDLREGWREAAKIENAV